MNAVVEQVFAVDEGEQRRVGTGCAEWKTPMDVVDVEHVAWDAPLGEDWTTRRVELQTSQGTIYHVDAVDDDSSPPALYNGDTHRGVLEYLTLPDDVQDDPRVGLPDLPIEIPERITVDALTEAVDDAYCIQEVADELEWNATWTGVLLYKLDLYDDLPAPEARPDKNRRANRA